jgi:hypothetical protein
MRDGRWTGTDDRAFIRIRPVLPLAGRLEVKAG